MLSCKEVTRLVSEGYERKLTLGERMSLKMHTMMCIGCTNYTKHMDFLRRAARRLREGGIGEDR